MTVAIIVSIICTIAFGWSKAYRYDEWTDMWRLSGSYKPDPDGDPEGSAIIVGGLYPMYVRLAVFWNEPYEGQQ